MLQKSIRINLNKYWFGNVTAVGDDDQCIYRFQGAYLTNFKDFSQYFKNTTLITLNQNYRSSKYSEDSKSIA